MRNIFSKKRSMDTKRWPQNTALEWISRGTQNWKTVNNVLFCFTVLYSSPNKSGKICPNITQCVNTVNTEIIIAIAVYIDIERLAGMRNISWKSNCFPFEVNSSLGDPINAGILWSPNLESKWLFSVIKYKMSMKILSPKGFRI